MRQGSFDDFQRVDRFPDIVNAQHCGTVNNRQHGGGNAGRQTVGDCLAGKLAERALSRKPHQDRQSNR